MTGSPRCGPAPHTRRALETDQRPPTAPPHDKDTRDTNFLLRRHSLRRTSASTSRTSGRWRGRPSQADPW